MILHRIQSFFYPQQMSMTPPPQAFCIIRSFVVNTCVSFYPLRSRELCDLLGILFISNNARGFLSQTSRGGRGHLVATRNNSWKNKSGGISLSMISPAYVVHQSPNRCSSITGSFILKDPHLAPPLLSPLQNNSLATVLTWFSHSQTCLRERKTRGHVNGTHRCV